MNRLALRTLYALHMVLPLAVVRWHLARLDDATLHGLVALFGRA